MSMRLNTLSPGAGAKKQRRRVGRGIGSGFGKTCGRGHKGQKSRSGGGVRLGFEGGQMPLIRRMPKSGFNSVKQKTGDEIRLSELNGLTEKEITLETLRTAGLISDQVLRVKVILSGEITRPVVIKPGIRVTAGARAAIEKAAGKIEE